jgi:hypothetical protein
MLQFDPKAHFEDLSDRAETIQRVELAMEGRKGSLINKIASTCQRKQRIPSRTRKDELQSSIRERISIHESLHSLRDLRRNKTEMRKEASLATRSLYGIVVLAMAPVVGITLLGLTISWNTIPIDLFPGMIPALEAFACFFQVIFFVLAIFIWDATTIWAYTDAVLCLVTPVADYFWYLAYRGDDGVLLTPPQITMFCLLTGYMTFRLWAKAVQPRHKSWQTYVHHKGSSATLDRLEVVWTTPSASQVSKILPDILMVWNALVDAWGYENARHVCRISIYVTDQDRVAAVEI